MINLESFDSAAAIVGRTGSGKTYAAKGVVEHLLDDNRRVCIIDPTGAWWGLRQMRLPGAVGEGAAFNLPIFGGDHADIPISDDAGALLGEIIAKGEVTQAIVDVSEMSTSAQIRFLTPFFEALYTGNRGALHLILDEADLMAPQNPLPETRRLQGVINKIVRRGRIKGFRPLMITQRPQVIDKSVLSQVDCLVAMKLTAPQDRKAILDWVKGHAGDDSATKAVDSLPGLKVGTGIVWRPSDGSLETVTFPPIRTFDSSKAPDVDDEPVQPMRLQRADFDKLRAALAPPESENPKSSATSAKGIQRPDASAIEEAEARGYRRGVRDMRDNIRPALEEAIATRQRAFEALSDLQGSLASLARKVADGEISAPSNEATKNVVVPKPAAEKRSSLPGDPAHSLTGPQAQVLRALRWWRSMGKTGPTRAQVAAICGWKVTSGHLKNVLGSLSSAGMVSYPEQGRVTLTAEGFAAAPSPDAGANVVDGIRSTLTGPQRQMFDELLKHKRAIAREDLAVALGWAPTSGHLKNVAGSLRTMEIIDYPQQGTIAIASWVKE